MSQSILDLPASPADARLSYGPGEYHFADLRLPTGAGPHPVVIGIHGGYWRARYGLDYFGHVCAALTAAGIATWNIEYRRLGNVGGGWPGTFQDAAYAADYLRQIAGLYSLDLTRVVAVGHSAGGHLALWLAGRHCISADSHLHDASPLPLSSVVSLAGVTDLRCGYALRLSDFVVNDFLGGSPADYPDRYTAASPIELLPLGVHQLLITGDADANVPPELSQRYYEAARAAGDPADLMMLPGVGHFEIVDPRSAVWPTVAAAMYA